MEFNTNTSNIIVPNNVGFIPTADKYSISLWFKVDILPLVAGRSYVLLRLFDNASSHHTFQITLPSDGNYISFGIFNTAGAEFGTEAQIPAIGFLTNTWYHIVCVNFGDGIPAVIYINGIDRTYWHNATFTGSMIKANGTLRIGNTSSTGSVAIDGCIDELTLWNRPLLAHEAIVLYNSGNGLPYCKNCNLNVSVDVIN